jgi:predicted nucleotidyltransferase
MNTTERNVIKAFRQLLARKLQVDQLVLFGSRARGDAAPDSDMDILVIIDTPTEDIEEYISSCAWEAGFEYGMVIVPVVYSKKEWESGIDRVSLLARAIEMEGVPL